MRRDGRVDTVRNCWSCWSRTARGSSVSLNLNSSETTKDINELLNPIPAKSKEKHMMDLIDDFDLLAFPLNGRLNHLIFQFLLKVANICTLFCSGVEFEGRPRLVRWLWARPSTQSHARAETSLPGLLAQASQFFARPHQKFQLNHLSPHSPEKLVFPCTNVPKAVLLEGSPGLGKTSIVEALAKLSGKHLRHLNLPGQFEWKDASFLDALQKGDWILLDEMTLAPQTILKGLNCCLDHQGTVYISQIDQTFKRHPDCFCRSESSPSRNGKKITCCRSAPKLLQPLSADKHRLFLYFPWLSLGVQLARSWTMVADHLHEWPIRPPAAFSRRVPQHDLHWKILNSSGSSYFCQHRPLFFFTHPACRLKWLPIITGTERSAKSSLVKFLAARRCFITISTKQASKKSLLTRALSLMRLILTKVRPE
ncbi:hypothetical protein VP01_2954g3, partial [Puccinia sorghi]